MKFFIVALLVGVAFATTHTRRSVEYENHNARRHQIRTNETPKRDRVSSGGGSQQTSSVWDMIMIRGANGHLESHADFMAEQMAIADGETETSVCKDCVLVAGWIKIALHDGAKLEEYKGLLEMLCGYLDGDQKTECLAIVDNLPAYIHQLEPLLDDPKAFCKEFGLCGSNQVVLSRVGRKLLHHIARRTEGPVPSNDVICDECLFMTKELKTIISEQSTEDQVKEALEGLCTSLGSYADECKSLMDQYFPLAWDELEALLADSRGLCNELGMCQGSRHAAAVMSRPMLNLLPSNAVADVHERLPSRPTPRLDSSMRFLRRIQTPMGTGGACILCKLGLTRMLDYARQHPEAVQQFEKTVRTELCQEIIPSAYATQCTSFMRQYLEPAMQMILEQLSAEEVCNAWQLCTARDLRTIEHRRITSEVKASMLCQACVVVAEFAQHEAADEGVQRDINHYLEQTCQQLPGEVQQECKSMIDQYLPAIWEFAEQELNPQVICPQLGLCDSADVRRQLANEKKESDESEEF